MAMIMWKITNLQFVEGDKWKNRAKVAQLAYRPILASRGNIYADNGSLLATSLPFYTVALDPTVSSDESFKHGIDLLSTNLSDFYGDFPAKYYKEKITHARKKNKKYLTIHKKYITYEERKKMRQWPIFEQGKFKGGGIFEEQYKRYNPFKELAQRTIGAHRQAHGFGLEYAFNKELKGENGQALYQKVVGGNWKQVQENTMVRPMHGYDLETTIDINLQDVTQSSLLTVLEQTSAQNGCAIVMEVATGAIKAIANLSRTRSGTYTESYNYAIGNQGVVEPGSIFKLASMLALLEETQWSLDKPIDTGNGAIKFYNRYMRDVKKGGYGLLTLQQVFEKSSNVGLSMAIHQTFGDNPQKFIDYIVGLGMHKPLGIELAGEGNPYIITPKSKMWSGIALPWLCVGYNLQITPLQILTLYNAVANNGKMVKPMFVKNIKSANGIVQHFPTTVLKEKICSDATTDKLKAMLEGTVARGTAQRIKSGFYKIAGKTGTSQKLVNGKYTDNHLTSFVGYFPADTPRYSCIIVVDSPQGEAYRFGADVPAPIFKEIVDRIAGKDLQARKPINGLASPESSVIKLFNTGNIGELNLLYESLHLPTATILKGCEWADLKVSATETTFRPRSGASKQEVPNVLNMKLRDALFLLESNGLEVTIVGNIHGGVSKQSLTPFKVIPTDRQITITLK
ncbi:penicillin-binding protein [Cardinium endosymbiont of Tipula unca]|uniref:penicillin-binding protein n=1 Tax=Cardinium endosymbiont of Tipula unca TaxID=3066216 RepID=UPI0030D48A04